MYADERKVIGKIKLGITGNSAKSTGKTETDLHLNDCTKKVDIVSILTTWQPDSVLHHFYPPIASEASVQPG